jgi:hypothetical protein
VLASSSDRESKWGKVVNGQGRRRKRQEPLTALVTSEESYLEASSVVRDAHIRFDRRTVTRMQGRPRKKKVDVDIMIDELVPNFNI